MAEADAQAEPHTFGQVAADILDLAAAPFGFELAIREALRDQPTRVDRPATRDRAAQIRAKWEAEIVTTARKNIVR